MDMIWYDNISFKTSWWYLISFFNKSMIKWWYLLQCQFASPVSSHAPISDDACLVWCIDIIELPHIQKSSFRYTSVLWMLLESALLEHLSIFEPKACLSAFGSQDASRRQRISGDISTGGWFFGWNWGINRELLGSTSAPFDPIDCKMTYTGFTEQWTTENISDMGLHDTTPPTVWYLHPIRKFHLASLRVHTNDIQKSGI